MVICNETSLEKNIYIIICLIFLNNFKGMLPKPALRTFFLHGTSNEKSGWKFFHGYGVSSRTVICRSIDFALKWNKNNKINRLNIFWLSVTGI